MLDAIQAKRAVLIAQREQLIGQVNMTNGAIAICDELLQEGQHSALAAEIQKAADVVQEARTKQPISVVNEGMYAAQGSMPAAAPEMLPVLLDDTTWPVAHEVQ